MNVRKKSSENTQPALDPANKAAKLPPIEALHYGG